MPKPLGVQLTRGPSGIGMRVTPIDRTADIIWDAVEEAQMAGWTAKQFLAEVKDAWVDARRDALKAELKDFDQ